MKQVVLSADGPRRVYSVPDVVAEDLERYCMEFCCEWLPQSPDAAQYRDERGWLCYTERDFIDYLNRWRFPEEPSSLVKELEVTLGEALPDRYADCSDFNF